MSKQNRQEGNAEGTNSFVAVFVIKWVVVRKKTSTLSRDICCCCCLDSFHFAIFCNVDSIEDFMQL